MTPVEPSKLSKDSTTSRKRRVEWSLTQEAFDKLLASFSQDRDEAGRQYEALRTRLVRFFERRTIPLAENRVDETLNRVARRIDEGKKVENVVAYAYRAAYLVFLEALKEPDLSDIDLEMTAPPTIEPRFEDSEQDRRLRCFDICLEGLTVNNRELILVYFREERRAKIERRKTLADQLKISLDALRIRIHRIRKGLEECMKQCMRQPI